MYYHLELLLSHFILQCPTPGLTSQLKLETQYLLRSQTLVLEVPSGSLDPPCFERILSISIRVLSKLKSCSQDVLSSTHCSLYGKLPPRDTGIPS